MNNSTRLIIAKLLETKRLALNDYHKDLSLKDWTKLGIEIIDSRHLPFIIEINKEIEEIRSVK